MSGRVALVTGGGRGVGAGIARALAADGWSVVVAARTTAEIEAVAAETGARAIELAPKLVRRLATGRYDALAGRYLHAADDLDALLSRSEEIREHDLQTVRLRR